MGFAGPTMNSMDSVADRDYVIELLICHVHDHDASEPFFPRKSSSGTPTSISLWRSMMPTVPEAVSCHRRKTPDIAELVRGKDRPCLWRADVDSDNHEGNSAGI